MCVPFEQNTAMWQISAGLCGGVGAFICALECNHCETITHISECRQMTIACRCWMWAVQDVTHTEISLLVCNLFEGSTTHMSLLLVEAPTFPVKVSQFTQVELNAKPIYVFALPLTVNVLFTPLLSYRQPFAKVNFTYVWLCPHSAKEKNYLCIRPMIVIHSKIL